MFTERERGIVPSVATGKSTASRETAESFVDAHQTGKTPEFQSISELAAEVGATPRAIRFYESKGLLSPMRVNGARLYSRRDRARLRLILRAKSYGVSLREIGDYLDLYGQHGEGRVKQLTFAVAKSEEVIAELEAKKRQIEETLAEVRHIHRVCKKKLADKKRAGR